MNEAMALASGVATSSLGDLLTFVGLPSKRSEQRLSGSAREMFKSITSVLDDFLLRAIEKRTAADFIAARDAIFSDYLKTLSAFASLVTVVVPDRVIVSLASESFAELEKLIADEGIRRFGPVATDQAVFTIWTLRKIGNSIAKITCDNKMPPDLKKQDMGLAAEFSFWVAWTQFHLDCLLAAIRFDKTVHPELLPVICDGLRAAVNAYGVVRHALHLRDTGLEELPLQAYAWDDEDQELLDSSMRDMESETI